jgi:hypothetical protein
METLRRGSTLDDGFTIDLPDGSVFFKQIEVAVTEGPDVHQTLD